MHIFLWIVPNHNKNIYSPLTTLYFHNNTGDYIKCIIINFIIVYYFTVLLSH